MEEIHHKGTKTPRNRRDLQEKTEETESADAGRPTSENSVLSVGSCSFFPLCLRVFVVNPSRSWADPLSTGCAAMGWMRNFETTRRVGMLVEPPREIAKTDKIGKFSQVGKGYGTIPKDNRRGRSPFAACQHSPSQDHGRNAGNQIQ